MLFTTRNDAFRCQTLYFGDADLHVIAQSVCWGSICSEIEFLRDENDSITTKHVLKSLSKLFWEDSFVTMECGERIPQIWSFFILGKQNVSKHLSYLLATNDCSLLHDMCDSFGLCMFFWQTCDSIIFLETVFHGTTSASGQVMDHLYMLKRNSSSYVCFFWHRQSYRPHEDGICHEVRTEDRDI